MNDPVDDVSLVDTAQEIHNLPEPRRQLVYRIRRQIAEGTYETEAKLELALERMLGGLLGEDEPVDLKP